MDAVKELPYLTRIADPPYQITDFTITFSFIDVHLLWGNKLPHRSDDSWEAGSVYPVSQSVQLQQHPRCFLRGFDTSVTHSQWHLLSRETWALTAPSISLSAHLTFCTSAWGCAEQDVATQAISSNLPKDPPRKPDINDPGNGGPSCDDTFSWFFVFCCFFLIFF